MDFTIPEILLLFLNESKLKSANKLQDVLPERTKYLSPELNANKLKFGYVNIKCCGCLGKLLIIAYFKDSVVWVVVYFKGLFVRMR